MDTIDPPITRSESIAIERIFMEGLRVLQGLEFRFPMIGAASIGDVMYQVTIEDQRDASRSENVVATIKSRDFTLVIPAVAMYRAAKVDLTMERAALTQGTRDQLRHNLTLVAMFSE